ncbi:BlaI/MecI/CopY family transcriptional regulator [Pseudonocardia sp. WMMC193]|uniref:BlaI/MecI/CopY family transcriptional regulator n=1 Tax=Pseudonocardia sp. WMMC193 TaxID=2911965 RepID=UPI0027DFF6AC|nr:BlaI/MecI/CopY family transcriptional regulator [Pseudonocardia sp. WMMC193]
MRQLGVLEGVVMNELWSVGGSGTVREMVDRLRAQRDLAYTTILSTMGNLVDKGYLTRTSEGRAHRYHAVMSRAEYAAQLMRDAMMRGGDADSVLLQFAGGLTLDQQDRLKKALEHPTGD